MSQLSLFGPELVPRLHRGVRAVWGDPAQQETSGTEAAAETELQCGEEEERRAEPDCESGEAAQC